MSSLTEYEPCFIKELEDFIDALKNEEHQSLCEYKTTLLHLAVVHDKIGLIKYLLDSGWDVNVKNSSGNTALLIALTLNKFEAMKILLDADADVRATDKLSGKNALEMFMTGRQSYYHYYCDDTKKTKWIQAEDIVPNFIDNLKRSNLDSQTIVKLLIAAHCPFKYVLTIKDTEVIRKFLASNHTVDNASEMKIAMEQCNLVNVELILRYGNNFGRSAFYRNLNNLFQQNKMDLWKVYVERLADWKVVYHGALYYLDYMFETADMQYIQILLDCKIDKEVREKYGMDLRVTVFGNCVVDVVKLMQNQDFDANARGINSQSALHRAAKIDSLKNMQFLLDSGADVELKDDKGRSALFECVLWNTGNTGQLLLVHGADAQAADDDGLTVFSFAKTRKSPLMEFLIAQLALSYVQDVSINYSIKKLIDLTDDYNEIFEACCRQLQLLKNSEIFKSITLFDILTTKIEKLCRSLSNQDIVALLDQYQNQYKLHLLYWYTLKVKLIKISNLHSFCCAIADVISQDTQIFIDFDHLVVRKITEYLTYNDMNKFIKSSM